MNIIRTSAVELSVIPAIAYKQKLLSGGSGLKLLRLDGDASAVFTMDKRGGLPVAYGKVDAVLFPEEAVDEALELTEGLPYSSRGNIRVSVCELEQELPGADGVLPKNPDMVDSEEYKAVVERYLDEKGKMNYKLMNKDFIQFAAKSKLVGELVVKSALEDDIILHVLKNRAGHLANKKESMSDEQTRGLMETLDEIDPRGAFKELKNYIRRMLAKK